jgi:hypothetical protein
LCDKRSAHADTRLLSSPHCRTILRGVEDLVKASQGADRQEKTLAPKTGVVWSACEQLTRLPKSNKVAYRRALLQVRPCLKEWSKATACIYW